MDFLSGHVSHTSEGCEDVNLQFFSRSFFTMISRGWIIPSIFFLLLAAPSQAVELVSGPMPGYVGMREATIWLQTQTSAAVQLRYWAQEKPALPRLSEIVAVNASTDFTAHIQIVNLEPGTEYSYQVYVDGRAIPFESDLTFHTQPFWQWRTSPPDFEVTVGSCAYINDPPSDRPGESYGVGFEIFDSIATRNPAFMLWLGDHIYLRETDIYGPTGIAHRYRHVRKFPALQNLLRGTHHVAIWDDHDYGPNNSNRSWIFKDMALHQFKQYWANPSYGLNELPGIFTVVSYGDVDFFLLDNRFYRDDERNPDHPEKGMFGNDQLQWLKNGLLASTANFKIVAGGSQFFDSQPDVEGWHHFPHERGEFLEWFRIAKPKGVLFLSGDRHLTKLLRYNQNVPYPLIELTCSPLTSRTRDPSEEKPNPWVVEDTVVGERNFCNLSFQHENSNRKLTIEVFNTQGTKLWSQTISRADFQEQ